MKLDVKELIKSINKDVNLIGEMGEITEDNLKQLLVHLCDVYDKSAVIKVLNSQVTEEKVAEPKKEVESYGLIEDIDEGTNEIDSEDSLSWEDKIDKVADVVENSVDSFEEKIDAEIDEILNEADTQLNVDEIAEDSIVEALEYDKPAEAWNHKMSLHEKIAKEKDDVSLAMKLQKKPIADLGKAMGLNEKVLFTKELFGGSKEEFDNHIEILNLQDNFEAAKKHLDTEVIPKFNWKGDDPAATHFISLLQRRFINA